MHKSLMEILESFRARVFDSVKNIVENVAVNNGDDDKRKIPYIRHVLPSE